MRRVIPWLYTALLFAVAAGFLVAAQVQSAAADTYLQARECQHTTSPDCFQLSAGTIRSVSVNQSRSGERDTTVGISETGGYDEVVGSLSVEKRAGANTNWVALAGQLAALIVFIIVFVVLLDGPTSR
jgi:hypothetical protein